ncbi:Rne/Rng family ribonuclease [Yunchengibacter salinarum]|uniref:Rne/Rng family ribonuclease n=1 Tax=Yunchengibacter salinarum TaxID=3133399 RepID=UPI0035B5AC40
MSTRMLIDARHDEETRVTIVDGNRVEEFDYESQSRRQLKGNIYLARVMRVEPSLQAAFVDYGGNRHGFLAFSEIHPDYYQIPVEDRNALLEAERDAVRAEGPGGNDDDDDGPDDEADTDLSAEDGEAPSDEDEPVDRSIAKESAEDEKDAEVAEAAAVRRAQRELKRRYKIQEVIKKRQVLLIQVVKEERGNKGAALTTYLSLAGRYCVLMPNSTHAGGISRKISQAIDRKRLKKIIHDLEVPENMGLIIRTAGIKRTKAEIKRDFDYLVRLWNGIRELTLKSIAPTLVYEEGDLIKRTIRDVYTREVDEILVEGEKGYRTAKDFMKLLMPSHAKKVQHYRNRIPLFHRYQVESQLESMYQPVVQLKAGGYIVINPTEALISVDVNSGRSTKEHNIEETALHTNLEAAEEVARQLRLRDMAGLIVIDFIDMEDRGNNRAVEKRLKDVLKNDRARVQVGRISSFGLLEMSRQRLRPNLLEASTVTCERCHGMGVVRSVDFAALKVLRELEEEGLRGRSALVTVRAHPDVAIYLLNKKRAIVMELERTYNMAVDLIPDPKLGPSDIDLAHQATNPDDRSDATVADNVITPHGLVAPSALPDPAEDAADDTAPAKDDAPKEDQPEEQKRRRPRKPRENKPESTENNDSRSNDDGGEDKPKPRRRRGRRGGRRRRKSPENQQPEQQVQEQPSTAQADGDHAADGAQPSEAAARGDAAENPAAVSSAPEKAGEAGAQVSAPAPEQADDATPAAVSDAETTNSPARKKPARRRPARKKAEAEASDAQAGDAPSETRDDAPAPKPRRRSRKKAEDSPAVAEKDQSEGTEAAEKPKPARKRPARKKPAEKAEAAPEAHSAPKDAAKADSAPKSEEPDNKVPAEDILKTVATQDTPAPQAPKQAAPRKDADTGTDGGNPKADNQPESDGDNPKPRKGWWSRTFG